MKDKREYLVQETGEMRVKLIDFNYEIEKKNPEEIKSFLREISRYVDGVSDYLNETFWTV